MRENKFMYQNFVSFHINVVKFILPNQKDHNIFHPDLHNVNPATHTHRAYENGFYLWLSHGNFSFFHRHIKYYIFHIIFGLLLHFFCVGCFFFCVKIELCNDIIFALTLIRSFFFHIVIATFRSLHLQEIYLIA